MNNQQKALNPISDSRNQKEGEVIDLRLGDCLLEMPQIPDKIIDMILCDLPLDKRITIEYT